MTPSTTSTAAIGRLIDMANGTRKMTLTIAARCSRMKASHSPNSESVPCWMARMTAPVPFLA